MAGFKPFPPSGVITVMTLLHTEKICSKRRNRLPDLYGKNSIASAAKEVKYSNVSGRFSMRFLRYLIMTGILLVPAAVYADDLGEVRLSLVEGDVQVQIKDTTDWTDAAVNLPMNEGDRLWIPDSSQAELQLRGGVYVRGDHDTALDILTSSHDSAQLYMDQGHIFINNRRGGIKTVQVDTPVSSLRTYDNSVMMVDVSDDGITEVSVFKGYVYAESRAGATRVSAGNTLTLRGEQSAEVAPIGPPDDWERWNLDRDRYLVSSRESSRYLPEELDEYAPDFDQYGRWEYEGDYGYVWSRLQRPPAGRPTAMGTGSGSGAVMSGSTMIHGAGRPLITAAGRS